jgi:DNA-binding protein H-NS
VRGNDLSSMSIDELWKLHQEVTPELARKLQAKKARLEQRLHQLQGVDNVSGLRAAPTLPFLRSIETRPTQQTWSGRGKQPRWIGSQIQAGRRLDDFLIDRAARRQ